MANTFSNLFSSAFPKTTKSLSGGSPLNTALQNKMNPSPTSSLVTSQPFSGSGSIFGGGTTSPAATSTAPKTATSGLFPNLGAGIASMMQPSKAGLLSAPTVTTAQNSTMAGSTAPKTTAPVQQQSQVTNLDNNAHTYSYGGQNYALNPATNRYEAVQGTSYTAPAYNPQQPQQSQAPQAGTSLDYATQIQNLAKLSAPEEQYLRDKAQITQDQQAKNINQYAEANLQSGLPDIERPDLIGRFPATQGLYDAKTNLAGITAAIPAQVAQASRLAQLQATQGLLTASLPAQQSLTNTLYNPITGQNTQGAGNDLSSRSQLAANVGLVPQYLNELNQAKTAINTIGQNEQLFNNFLSTTNVNPSDVTAINSLLNKFSSKFSSADYANFNNLLASLRASYTTLLAGRGMTPSDAGDTASRLIPDDASPATITKVLQTLKQEGQNFVNSKQQQYDQAVQGTQGASATTNSSTNSAGWF